MYLSNIAALSDRTLIERVGRLATREREATAALVAHLAELEARRLHLKEGHSSLFMYCTQALHLSEQAAYNRIEAARAARRFPIVLARLADGTVHLTAIRLLTPILTEENHEELLEEARHRSRREVEEIVARIRPAPPVPPSVRRLPELAVPRTVVSPPVDPLPLAPASASPQSTPAPASSPLFAAGVTTTPQRPVVAPLAPGSYRVQFTASGEMHERLRHAQAILRHQVPNGDIAAIFDLALQALIERVETRKFAKRKRPQAVKREVPQPPVPEPRVKQERRSRYIPADVRRWVWERDGGRCAYVSPSGRRCTEVSFLEFEHREPYACGGPATVENIELRCRGHNAYEAEQRFGLEKVRSRVPRARGTPVSIGAARRKLPSTAPTTCENVRNSSRDELRMKSQARGGSG